MPVGAGYSATFFAAIIFLCIIRANAVGVLMRWIAVVIMILSCTVVIMATVAICFAGVKWCYDCHGTTNGRYTQRNPFHSIISLLISCTKEANVRIQ